MNQVPTATAPTVQLLLWIAEQPRTYAETIEVWKTSCPRLAVWEDALAADLVRLDRRCVLLTAAGKELLTGASVPPRMHALIRRVSGIAIVKNAASRFCWSHVWRSGCDAAWDLIFARAHVTESALGAGLL